MRWLTNFTATLPVLLPLLFTPMLRLRCPTYFVTTLRLVWLTDFAKRISTWNVSQAGSADTICYFHTADAKRDDRFPQRSVCILGNTCLTSITHVSDSLLVFGGENKMLAKRQVQCINGQTLGKPAQHDMCHLPARWLSSPSFWTRWHSISRQHVSSQNVSIW